MPGTRMPSPIATAGSHLVTVDGHTLPLRSAHLEARAGGGLVVTTLTQQFENRYLEPLEVHYVLPLPADGAVIGYTARFGETTIRGIVKSRGHAEADYELALREGRAAALLEEDREDTFRQRLGSIPPGQDVEVRIEVLHPLAFVAAETENAGEGALWEYRFPTVVGIRYSGEPGRVDDTERLDVDRADALLPVACHLELTLGDPGVDAAAVTSPDHQLSHTLEGEHLVVRFASGARLDRDVVVRWPGCAPEIAMRIAEGVGLEGDDGRYGLIVITPPKGTPATQARDLTLLVDSSGSMDGEPLAWAKQVVHALVEDLGDRDRFEILCFGNETRRLTQGMVAVRSQAAGRALRDLERVTADGGTEMAKALHEALRPLRPDSQRQVVLITDGMIGFESEILGGILRDLPAGARVHVVAIGSAPNRTLTRGVARAGRGVEAFVSASGDLDRALRSLSPGLRAPILTEVELGGAAIVTPATARPRDVFAGQPLVVAAELSAHGGDVIAKGRLAGGKQWICRLEMPARDASPAPRALPVGALFGRERIAELEMSALADPHSMGSLEGQIERIAMRHRITSPATSLVAVADGPSVDPLQPRIREIVPVEMPAHMTMGHAIGMQATHMLYNLTGTVFAKVAGTRHLGQFMTGSAEALDSYRLESFAPLAAILHWDGDTLSIEFEVPHDDFELPDDARLIFHDRMTARLVTVPEASSPRGPHAKSRIVRLTLRWKSGATRGRPVKLHWTCDSPDGGRSRRYDLTLIERSGPPA